MQQGQVDREFVAADFDALLATYECEPGAELEKEPVDVPDQSVLHIVLVRLVADSKDVKVIGVLDRFHCELRFSRGNPQLMRVSSPDSTYVGRELEGYETVNARSRSEKFGWTAAVAVPKLLLLAQFLGPTGFAALTGFLVCLVALGTVGLLASRPIRDVRVLSKAAEPLSERQVVQAGAMHITELKGVP